MCNRRVCEGGLEEEHVPGAPLLVVVRQKRAEHRWPVRHGGRDESADLVRRHHGGTVRGNCTPVVTEHNGGVGAQRADQLDGVQGEHRALIAAVRC